MPLGGNLVIKWLHYFIDQYQECEEEFYIYFIIVKCVGEAGGCERDVSQINKPW
jgi:hypothetical protein